MLKLFSSKHHTILGIDISPSSVKILEIASVGSKYRVEGYGRVNLPEAAMEGSAIKDIEAVASAIKQILISEKISSKQAALAVPDSSAISRVVQMNQGLSEDEIEELVTIEADKYIPYPIDEISLDFNILGPSSKNPAMLDVLLVASRTENVNSRVEAITKAGLSAKIVDVESFAVERTVGILSPQLPAEGANKIVVVIDIGSVSTHFFALYNLQIIFAREEEFGSRQLLEAIKNKYEMSEEEAEAALSQGTLPEEYQEEIARPFQETILLQIKRGLQFFFSTSHHSYVDYIFLAGGIAKETELAALVQEHINIPTAVADPIKYMDISKQINPDKVIADSPCLMVACGLALRGN